MSVVMKFTMSLSLWVLHVHLFRKDLSGIFREDVNARRMTHDAQWTTKEDCNKSPSGVTQVSPN